MEKISMDTENSKANEPHKFVFNFSQRLDLKSPNKHAALQKLSVSYTWENMRQQYKNNNLNLIAPTWNDEFELPDGLYSLSEIQDYIEYTIKIQITLLTNHITLIYINRINNRRL